MSKIRAHKHIYLPELSIFQTRELIAATYRKQCTICSKPIGRRWAITEANKYAYKPKGALSRLKNYLFDPSSKEREE